MRTMKKYCISTKIKSLLKSTGFKLLLALFVMGPFCLLSAKAKTVGVVAQVQGRAFLIAGQKTTSLVQGDVIEDLSEVMTDEASQIKIVAPNQVTYYLSSMGQIKFLNKLIELKKGHMWFQSPQTKGGPYTIQSANAQLQFWSGEGIMSYDTVGRKSQFLSVNGGMEFSHLMEKHLMVVVDSGFFSFIQDKENEGRPRKPTQIGAKSYRLFTSLFQGVRPMSGTVASSTTTVGKAPEMVALGDEEVDIINDAMKEGAQKSVAPSRSVASVTTAAPSEEAKSGVIVRRLPEEIEVPQVNIQGLYQEKLKAIRAAKKARQKWSVQKTYASGKHSSVEIKIYGRGQTKTAAPMAMGQDQMVSKTSSMPVAPEKSTQRAPASVDSSYGGVDTFESSLMKQYKSQMRHDHEVNSLINQLNNYKQDYQESY